MNAGTIQAGLILLCGAAVTSGAAVLSPDRPERATPLPARVAAPPVQITRTAARFDSLLRAAAARAPFRSNRVAAAIAYDPDRPPQPGMPTPPPAPKPTLALSGIVWGTAPAAVLEGVPGVDGPRVVRAGESVGGLRVKRIRRDAIVVVGLDTSWTLKVRMPWP
ncbi:MAG TPA: hypothetical protein VFS33_04200 [Gemmatimonadales bacterium]|nr:hypothetical protein [Gemmatimonadales bacterium]